MDKENKDIVYLGIDCGTMNLCCARSGSDEVKRIRNVFLSVTEEEIPTSDLSNISYVRDEDNIYIIGDDAFKFANLFGQPLQRPMAKGLISAKEIDAANVLSLMIKSLVGNIKNKDVKCNYSIPAEPIDEERSVIYHTELFRRIFNELGITAAPINEAMAIIYSECKDDQFSGCSFSFGAGMVNVCVAGDTKILLLNGSVKTIKELAEYYNNKEFWVYSCKADGTIVPGKAYNPRKTGEREVIRVHLDNETYIDCTEDHKWMLRDGTYCETKDLKPKTSLMPLYIQKSLWNEMPGYLSVYNNKHKHWEMVHSMVMRECYGIFRKKGHIIHHKNFTPLDNTPENLIQISKEDHIKIHKIGADYILENVKGKTYEEIYGKEKTKEIKSKMIEWHSDGNKHNEWLSKIKESSELIGESRRGKKYEEIFPEKSESIKQKMSEAKSGKTYEDIMKDERDIIKRKKQLKDNAIKQGFGKHERTEEILKKSKPILFKKGMIPWNKGLKGDKYLSHFKDGIKNQYSCQNHKVIRIERLNKKVDVYDLSVHRYHNFATDNGVFLHNCISYKGLNTIAFSTVRSGDWIDSHVAESLSIVQNRVTGFKERKLDLSNIKSPNKKDRRILEALKYYYEAALTHAMKKTIKKFQEEFEIELDEPLPIIVSGGTSLAKGFLDLFKNIAAGLEWPFEIKEIRQAKNPLTAVAEGLLIKTLADFKN